RTTYRVLAAEQVAPNGFKYRTYELGPDVDITGVTPQGQFFTGIDEYKRLLLENEIDQVARNVVSKLLVFATGAEIDFADRDEVERILTKLADGGYPIRTMIREVVTSGIFRSL
ncbi:MAG: DUF1585 domain-containing protein, partial [Acidobacteriota bacterium]|nr:DUF1585 domain-containing protein [Acidobacteriota bacterium]